MNNVKELLEKLSNAHGVSGYEGNIRQIIEEEVRPYVDEISTDKMGNLIATKYSSKYNDHQLNGTQIHPIVMLAAHMDEIGLMVRYIDNNGFIYFTEVGGWFSQTLLNQRMILHTEKDEVYGVIGSKPPHVMTSEDRNRVIKSEDMFIDVGAKNKEDAEKMGVKIGTTITSDRKFTTLKNDLVSGKCFDNRAGCVMLIMALREMKNVKATIHAVFTVQEEVGCKGAKVTAFKLDPDVALATDVTIPGDHPNISEKDSTILLGEGAAVIMSDGGGRGLIVNPKVLNWIETTAKSNDIKYQLEVSDGGTTDGMSIHLAREGIPTGVISIPTRYIHTPVEVLNIKDLENSILLLARSLETVHEYFKE